MCYDVYAVALLDLDELLTRFGIFSLQNIHVAPNKENQGLYELCPVVFTVRQAEWSLFGGSNSF